MIDVYLITMQKIIVMFTFIALGFVLRTKGVLPDQTGKVLSVLETNLFLPAMILRNLSSNLSRDAVASHLTSLAVGAGFLVASIVIARLLATFLGKSREERSTLAYIFAFSNYAYFGYPIIESVFGPRVLARTIILAVPFTITIYTYGVRLLTDASDVREATFARRVRALLTPVVVSVILGGACGLASIEAPAVLSDILSMASACMSPVSMILTGFVLAAFSFVDLFRSAKAYLTSTIRLILIPAVFAASLWLIGLRGESFVIPVAVASMPVGMNVVVFAEASGKDSKNSARACFVSYIAALFTIPVIFGALAHAL